jgi:malic enzyme
LVTREQALAYHADGRPGKLKITPTKPTETQDDLSLAYTPGVAEPCREIARDPSLAFRYTAKGNLVAVISNGTAVPKPFDPRILTYVVPAVAQAAMDSGVARRKIDIVEYGHQLSKTAVALSNM